VTTFARTALLTLCALALEAREPARAASPGDIDPTFNGGGPVLLDLAQTLPRITDLTGVAVAGQ